MVRNCIFVLLCSISQLSWGQQINGAWYGKADVALEGTHNNYLTELVLKQKGDRLEGVFGYYFRNTYQSFYIRGTFDKDTREVNIKNLPLTYFLSTGANGIECPMNFRGTLLVSKVKAVLNGYFYTESKYKYTCPELRVSMKLDVDADKDSALKDLATGTKIWKPQQEDVVVNNAPPKTKTADTVADKAVVANTTARPDSSSSHDTATAKALPSNTTSVNNTYSSPNTNRLAPGRLDENATKKLVADFEKRKVVYNKDLEIEGDSIRVSFYDNGEVDGDSISVFLNREPILANQGISTRALNVYLALDSTKEVNELSMFANNLGKIPPNTALMVVTDGKNRYEVFLSSSFTQNATIRLRKKKG